MFIKIIISILVLYFFVLLQSSFMPHFAVLGNIPNIALIATIFLIFLMPSLSFSSAILGGVLLDIFSTHFFGFNVLILLGIATFINFILRKYVQIPIR